MHRIEISVKSDPEHGISPTIVCIDTKTRLLLFFRFLKQHVHDLDRQVMSHDNVGVAYLVELC